MNIIAARYSAVLRPTPSRRLPFGQRLDPVRLRFEFLQAGVYASRPAPITTQGLSHRQTVAPHSQQGGNGICSPQLLSKGFIRPSLTMSVSPCLTAHF